MPLISGGFRGHSTVQVNADKSAQCLDCNASAPTLNEMPRADEPGGKICLPVPSARGAGFTTTAAVRKRVLLEQD